MSSNKKNIKKGFSNLADLATQRKNLSRTPPKNYRQIPFYASFFPEKENPYLKAYKSTLKTKELRLSGKQRKSTAAAGRSARQEYDIPISAPNKRIRILITIALFALFLSAVRFYDGYLKYVLFSDDPPTPSYTYTNQDRTVVATPVVRAPSPPVTPLSIQQCMSLCIRYYVYNIFPVEFAEEMSNIATTFQNSCSTANFRDEDVQSNLIQISNQRVSIVYSTTIDIRRKHPQLIDPLLTSPAKDHTAEFSVTEVRNVQTLLDKLGYQVGKIDGFYGKKTSDAIKKFQSDLGLYQSGHISRELIAFLTEANANCL
jgi:hypothetical protein